MTNDKLFWEKFGFKWVVRDSMFPEEDGVLVYPDGTQEPLTHENYPEPNQDNLFRYCEEKALEKIQEVQEISFEHARIWLFKRWCFFVNSGLPHAIALKKAIEESLEVTNNG